MFSFPLTFETRIKLRILKLKTGGLVLTARKASISLFLNINTSAKDDIPSLHCYFMMTTATK